MPGVYCIVGNDEQFYIGSSRSIGMRLRNHYYHSSIAPNRHPVLYNYINNYGWSSIKVGVLIVSINHLHRYLELHRINPSMTDLKLLDTLTMYESLCLEQYFLDKFQPGLNSQELVAKGGLPNKGPLGIPWSQSKRDAHSLSTRGRQFNASHIERLSDAQKGKRLSQETRDKMSGSHGGAKIYSVNVTTGDKTFFDTKSIRLRMDSPYRVNLLLVLNMGYL
uniref:Orf220 n=1 Tax=Spizellomyces punctatus TaxID=109760 RepID=Q950S4_SPIPN|nr:orf220 [Spizellomyces punctatus]AAK84234.1 orf220 [Spizellomyces punctatus]